MQELGCKRVQLGFSVVVSICLGEALTQERWLLHKTALNVHTCCDMVVISLVPVFQVLLVWVCVQPPPFLEVTHVETCK